MKFDFSSLRSRFLAWGSGDSVNGHEPSPKKPTFWRREALQSDLEDMTRVLLASLPSDPQWPYRYPYASKFPGDSSKFSRLRLSEYLDGVTVGAYKVLVVDTSSTGDVATRTVVAFAVYQLPGHHQKSGSRFFFFSLGGGIETLSTPF